MLQMSFVYSRLRGNRTTTGGCSYDDGALTGMKCTDLTTRPPSITVYLKICFTFIRLDVKYIYDKA